MVYTDQLDLISYKDKKLSKIQEKPIDQARINRNTKMLKEIDDMLSPYKLNSKKLFEMSHKDRLRALKDMDQEDRENINYLIHGLFQ